MGDSVGVNVTIVCVFSDTGSGVSVPNEISVGVSIVEAIGLVAVGESEIQLDKDTMIMMNRKIFSRFIEYSHLPKGIRAYICRITALS